MGIFGSSSKMDVMKKTQENLELSQKNLELMSTALERVPANHATHLEPEITVLTDEEKRKAAYALNLCMISVSQIIDYNDIYILEQEYDAILNNLNIEEMPKDEALLNILKQLLDVVTFFRIQEGEKEFIEKRKPFLCSFALNLLSKPSCFLIFIYASSAFCICFCSPMG